MILPDVPVLAAGDLVAMLRRHYLPESRPPGGIFAGEIESPDGRRRADALWAPWSIAGGEGLIGHEVKVTRADVLAELADPMKAEPWARYCSRWWLVIVRPSLVEGLDVPDAWGIMAPPSGRRTRSMTIVRPARLLKPADTGPAWRRVATWEHNRLTDRLRDADYFADRHKRDAEDARSALIELRLGAAGRESREDVFLGRLVTELRRREVYGVRFEVEEIAAAIEDVAAHRRLADRTRMEITWLADEARRQARALAAPLDRLAGDLAKLAKTEVLA